MWGYWNTNIHVMYILEATLPVRLMLGISLEDLDGSSWKWMPSFLEAPLLLPISLLCHLPHIWHDCPETGHPQDHLWSREPTSFYRQCFSHPPQREINQLHLVRNHKPKYLWTVFMANSISLSILCPNSYPIPFCQKSTSLLSAKAEPQGAPGRKHNPTPNGNLAAIQPTKGSKLRSQSKKVSNPNSLNRGSF